MTTFSGEDPSPRTAAELALMSDGELRDFLLDWRPPQRMHFIEPTRSSLARELNEYAKRNISRLFRRSMLEGLHSRYVVAVVQAAQELTHPAMPDGVSLDSILDAVEWTISQPDGRGAEASDRENDWIWARRAALDLTSNLIRHVEPANDAVTGAIWKVLERLLSDIDPAPTRSADEARSLSSVRATALRATIALAVHLRARAETSIFQAITRTLVSMCDPAREPVAVVRHVCARDFHNIRIVAAGAANEISRLLFPAPGRDDPDRRAAWATFIRSNPTTRETYELLRTEYAHAVRCVGETPREAGEALGVHLTRLTLWGILPIDDGGPLAEFVRLASVKVRQHSLEQVGRALHRHEGLKPETLERAQRLWTSWKAHAASTGDTADLAAFGWWFTGGGLPDGWFMTELGTVLRTGSGSLDWEHAVAERLAELAPAHPHVVAGLMEAFLGSGDEWRYARSQQGVRATIEALRATAAAPAARALASRLVARGVLEYRELAL